jgi:hypothetical protein
VFDTSCCIEIDLTFLTSKLSAVALTGLLLSSRISNFTTDLLLNIAPFHRLGRKALIGVSARSFDSIDKIERRYIK